MRCFSGDGVVLCRQFRRTRSERRATTLEPINIDWIAVFVREFDTDGLRATICNPFVRVERHTTDVRRMIQNQPNISRAYGSSVALAHETNFGRRPVDDDHVVVIGRAARSRGASIAVEWLSDDVITTRFEQDEKVHEYAATRHADRNVLRVRVRRNRTAVATHTSNHEIDAPHVFTRREAEMRSTLAVADVP